jgi:UDPglucose 6-dehydrogenase
MNLGWIGLGKCGFPIAEEIAKTCKVIAYDIVYKETTYSTFTSNVSDLANTDIVFILVQTPHLDPTLDGSVPVNLNNTQDYDYTALSSALDMLTTIGYKNTVVISSTVSPGTTAKLANKFDKLKLAYMPVMIHIGSVADDYVTAPMYYIGTNSNDIKQEIENVLKLFVKTDKFLHGTWEEVELYKMLGNMYSSIKIAFANTISEIIEYGNFNASSWNVMSALLTDTVRFNSAAYLSPGSGNGGPCHPRDGVVLSWLTDQLGMDSTLLKDVTFARQQQALALAKHLVSYNMPIVILGKTFKPGVDLTVGSYSVLVGSYCEQMGATVYYDTSISADAVVLLAHRNADLLKKHTPTENSVIVDLWNLNLQQKHVKVWGNNKKHE